MKIMKLSSVLFAWLLISPVLSPADSSKIVVGKATVLDGDTLRIGETKIRLHGIDAPEKRQRCRDESDDQWQCGARATCALLDKTSGRNIRCEIKQVDRYKRQIAVCFNKHGDINGQMVMEGWARAYLKYSRDYEQAEKIAKKRKAGIWRGQHVAPWKWRKEKRKKK